MISDRAVPVLLLGILLLNCFIEFGTDAQAPLAQNEGTFLEQLHSSLLCDGLLSEFCFIFYFCATEQAFCRTSGVHSLACEFAP